MTLDPSKRDEMASILDGYLKQAKWPSWVTLWYRPSTLEPEVARLVAVLDNPKTLSELTRKQDEIEKDMKVTTGPEGMRLFMELIPTSEFHLRYQTQSGYELIREWNAETSIDHRRLNLWNWIKFRRTGGMLLPVLIVALLFFVIRLFTQQGL